MENLLEDFSQENLQAVRRRSLLPIWMKVFIWFFMIAGLLITPIYVVGLFGTPVQMELYGLATTQSATLVGSLLFLLFLLKGLASYALWFEKDWAIIIGLVDAIAGMLICAWSMIYSSFILHDKFMFRWELVTLVPYLLKLLQIKKSW